jgi:uncharacterized damage-inducible protein DinB
MYTAPALLDIHTRAHRSLQALLRHCGGFGAPELAREFEGFGYPSMREQLDHVIGAEEYWMNVVCGRYTGGDPEEIPHPDTVGLEAYRAATAERTASYLRGASDAELNTPRTMLTWPGRPRLLVPALVVLRTQTHIFQHQGQILAICRLLGRPSPGGLDFPLD